MRSDFYGLSIDQAGMRATAIPGKGQAPGLLDDIIAAFEPFDAVYIALDPDAGREAAALAVALGDKATVVKLPDKPDDLLVLEGWTPEQLLAGMRATAIVMDAGETAPGSTVTFNFTTNEVKVEPPKSNLSPEARARRDRILSEVEETEPPLSEAEEQAELNATIAAEKKRIDDAIAEMREYYARVKGITPDLGYPDLSEEAKKERQAELNQRYEAGNNIPFYGDEVHPDYIEWKRSQFSDNKKWYDYCLKNFPDIDADEQRNIKLLENKEERIKLCGTEFFGTTLTGRRNKTTSTCGLCDRCKQRNAMLIMRAIHQITDTWKEPEPDVWDDNPGENAPPLAVVHGDLSVVTIPISERAKFTRTMSRAGIAKKAYPYAANGSVVVDFIVNDDRGTPLVDIKFDRVLLWSKGTSGHNASGNLIPAIGDLRKRFREHDRYEVVMPELDDDGRKWRYFSNDLPKR